MAKVAQPRRINQTCWSSPAAGSGEALRPAAAEVARLPRWPSLGSRDLAGPSLARSGLVGPRQPTALAQRTVTTRGERSVDLGFNFLKSVKLDF